VAGGNTHKLITLVSVLGPEVTMPPHAAQAWGQAAHALRSPLALNRYYLYSYMPAYSGRLKPISL
jgi:hypothetical protein